MENCLTSLRTNGFYESSMTEWQFDPSVEKWEDIDLGVNNVSWTQYEACDGLWSNAVLVSSAEDPDTLGRFIFPGFIPTAVKSTDVIQEMVKHDSFFKALPACGGNVVCWSLIGALDEALSSCVSDKSVEAKLVRLYEASLTITVRMRLNPSSAQLLLDQMSYVDILRVQNVASGATSFFEFALQVLRLPAISPLVSGPELVKKLSTFGIQFKGKPVDRNLAYSILSVVGTADKGRGKDAVRFLERICPQIVSDPTKLLRAFQVLKKLCSPEEWHEGCVMLMECMGVAILSGDEDDENFTGDYLVPKERRKIGYVHSAITKMKFNKWFMDEQSMHAASGASSGALSSDGLAAIKLKCSSPRVFWSNFADHSADSKDSIH